MKKFLLVVFAAMLLIACSASPKLDSRLVGKWKCDMLIAYQIFEFRSDMTCSMDTYWSDGEQLLSFDGEYSVTENELNIDFIGYPCTYKFEYGNLFMYDPEEDEEYMYFKID